ncbi:MatE family protein [Tritrichomonas foetus]|uniref:MatE family protein n=1 Tax=Tritrichomonas foetus TaxID=1144522 RepID=A0A1J4K3H3_9EUKA|nr:MatE family protein [Tritrichomonas foetus]|eukprot:OHT05993.1 MatE family protein [Tritrichomonas foetus]
MQKKRRLSAVSFSGSRERQRYTNYYSSNKDGISEGNKEHPISENQQLDLEGEEKRLGSGKPLTTILILSVGTLISRTVQALYGVVNLFWVSKTIGDKGMEVFGAVYIVDFVAIGIADYLMTSLDIRVSYLFGEKQKVDECSQIFVDFIRVSFLFGLLVPAIILPITRTLIEWFGSDKEISLMCFQYMLPATCGSCLNFFYMIACGLIQSEGHSIIFGITQIVSLVLNMCCFCPLFLVVFKLPIWGASLTTVVSEGLVGLVLNFLIFRGKFTLKPKLSMLFKKFSKETWESLKIGFASLISNLADSLPTILLQKYINSASKAIGEYDNVIQVWGVIEKLYQFVGGSNEAFSIGLMPSASFAYGAKRYNRMIRLFFHATWIPIMISIVYALFMILIPDKISSIWNTDEKFLYWCREMIPKVFYATPCFPIQYMVPALLQGMQLVYHSTILAGVTVFLPMPLFASILYFTNKTDPARIMWTYALADSFACLVCTIFILPSLFKLKKLPRDEDLINTYESLETKTSFAKSDTCVATPLLPNYSIE